MTALLTTHFFVSYVGSRFEFLGKVTFMSDTRGCRGVSGFIRMGRSERKHSKIRLQLLGTSFIPRLQHDPHMSPV